MFVSMYSFKKETVFLWLNSLKHLLILNIRKNTSNLCKKKLLLEDLSWKIEEKEERFNNSAITFHKDFCELMGKKSSSIIIQWIVLIFCCSLLKNGHAIYFLMFMQYSLESKWYKWTFYSARFLRYNIN